MLAWAGLFVVATLASSGIQHTQGGLGALGAVAVGVALVSGAVVWIGGAVLAARMRSLLLLIGVLLFGPLGSVFVAIVTPSSPPAPPPVPPR